MKKKKKEKIKKKVTNNYQLQVHSKNIYYCS